MATCTATKTATTYTLQLSEAEAIALRALTGRIACGSLNGDTQRVYDALAAVDVPRRDCQMRVIGSGCSKFEYVA